jgi:carboxypeptidase PM20D1
MSRIDTPAFGWIQTTLAEVFPDMLLLPVLATGGTDARYFYDLCESVYRLTPLRLVRDDLRRVHGVNERVPIEPLGDAVRFYVRLIERSAR